MERACQVFCVRRYLSTSALFAFLSTAALTALTGCVDAPLQPAHLAPDGQLRGVQMEQSARLSAQPMTANRVNLTAVLAAQEFGALEDSTLFPHRVEDVHLHLRAAGLTANRPVTFVWSHGEERFEIRGVIAPSRALALASSRSITHEDIGVWTIEVYEGDDPLPATGADERLLLRRDFQVL